MNKKWPWILLAVSVAFNLFFVVGAVRHHRRFRRVRTPEGRAERFAEQLGLDAEQRTAFFAWDESFRQARAQMGKGRRERAEGLWAELVKDEPDQAVLREFMEGKSDPDRRRRLVEKNLELMRILRPEQRQRAAGLILKRLRRRFGRRGPK